MKGKTVRLLSLLGVLAVAACGDDPAGLTGDLSEAEAEDLAGLIFQLGFLNSLTLGGPQAVDGPARIIETTTDSFQTTGQCPAGGTVGLDATVVSTYDTETFDSSIEFTITQTHNNCMGQGQSGGTFTLNGNPSIAFGLTANSNVQTGAASWSGGTTGSIAWETGGRSGTCTVSLEYSGTADGNGGVTFNMGGNICARSISRSATIGVG